MAKDTKKIFQENGEEYRVEPVKGFKNLYSVKQYDLYGGWKWRETCRLEFDESKGTYFILSYGLGHGINIRVDTGKTTLEEAVHELAAE